MPDHLKVAPSAGFSASTSTGAGQPGEKNRTELPGAARSARSVPAFSGKEPAGCGPGASWWETSSTRSGLGSAPPAAPSYTELPATLRRFADTPAALTALLQRARTLGESGTPARLPVKAYLDALGSVLRFIKAHPVLHTEVNLSAEMCGAVMRIAEELQGRPPRAPGLAEPLAVLPPLSVQHEEAIRTGVLLLVAYRQAVQKGLRGAKAAFARAEFAVDGELGTRDGSQVASGIARFLYAAERYPEVLIDAGLTGPQLLGLAAQERVLRAFDAQRRDAAVASGSAYRAQVLHLALESFFDRYSAVLMVRMLAQPEEQLRGLALAPRSGTARPSGRRLADYAACRVTDSGRLVF